MTFLKTLKEIKIIKEGCDILSKVHGMIAKEIRPGVKTIFLNNIADNFIRDFKAVPSFKGYRGFPFSICTSVNEYIVHGFPSDYVLKEGDIISIDCGVYYKGFHSDSAFTYPVGKVDKSIINLLEVTKNSLYLGIDSINSKSNIGNIGYFIQNYIESFGYSIVKDLVGHGIGKNLHEKPEVPNYGKKNSGLKLCPGMVIAIEPMVNFGTSKVFYEKNGWFVRTSDKKPSAHFEHTVAILDNKVEILTTYKYIENFFKYD